MLLYCNRPGNKLEGEAEGEAISSQIVDSLRVIPDPMGIEPLPNGSVLDAALTYPGVSTVVEKVTGLAEAVISREEVLNVEECFILEARRSRSGGVHYEMHFQNVDNPLSVARELKKRREEIFERLSECPVRGYSPSPDAERGLAMLFRCLDSKGKHVTFSPVPLSLRNKSGYLGCCVGNELLLRIYRYSPSTFQRAHYSVGVTAEGYPEAKGWRRYELSALSE